MTKKRRQPPSRQRYAAAHPAITAHLDLKTYARVRDLQERSGLSAAQLFRQALGQVETDIETVRLQGEKVGLKKGHTAGYTKGLEAGYARAKAKYAVTYECSLCGLDCEMTSGSDAAKAAAEALFYEDWPHPECLEEKQRKGYVIYRGER